MVDERHVARPVGEWVFQDWSHNTSSPMYYKNRKLIPTRVNFTIILLIDFTPLKMSKTKLKIETHVMHWRTALKHCTQSCPYPQESLAKINAGYVV